jgi:hypothetical protein
VAWDPLKFDLSTYLSCGGIYLTGTLLEKKQLISFLNIYGPCVDRRDFWTKVVDSGILAHNNLIAVGDFNLTMSVGEIWGESAQPDPLADFFKVMFLWTQAWWIFSQMCLRRHGGMVERAQITSLKGWIESSYRLSFEGYLVVIGLGLHILFYRIMHQSCYSWIIAVIHQPTHSN